MERHSETFGNALQLFYGHILASTADSIQIGTLHPQYVSQLLFTHVFSLITFSSCSCDSYFSRFIVVCFFLKVRNIKSPTARSRAVRPIGYFAVLQDAEQISVPAVQAGGSGGLPVGSPTQNGFRRGCAAAVSADKVSRAGGIAGEWLTCWFHSLSQISSLLLFTWRASRMALLMSSAAM